jgi:hypothetical protein
MADSDDEENDAFSLCPTTLSILGLIGTEMMFQETKWSVQDDYLKGDLIKRISAWSDSHLRKSMPEVVEAFFPIPGFVTRVIEDFQNSTNSKLFDFHLSLLVQVSVDVINGYIAGVGAQTGQEINHWFNLMNRTRESSLFQSSSKDYRDEFLKMLNIHTETKKRMKTTMGDEERPFFHHQILFIRVSLMVYVHTKTNGIIALPKKANQPWQNPTEQPPGRIPHHKTAMLITDVAEVMDWERKCGELLEPTLKVSEHGMHLGFLTGNSGQLPFPMISLPYNIIPENMLTTSVPQVTKVHDYLMQRLLNKVREYFEQLGEISEWERTQWETFDDLVQKFGSVNEEIESDVIGSEKCRRNYYRNHEKKMGPRHPSKYTRTIFILGQNSFSSRFAETPKIPNLAKGKPKKMFDGIKLPSNIKLVKKRKRKDKQTTLDSFLVCEGNTRSV